MRMRARGHWDLDPRAVSATTYQEMRFLTDAARGEGSFERLPSIFQDLDRYLHEHPGRVLDAPVDVAGHDVVEVPARAGDLAVWDPGCPIRVAGTVAAGRGSHWPCPCTRARGRRPSGTHRMLEAETRSSVVAWLEGTDQPGAG